MILIGIMGVVLLCIAPICTLVGCLKYPRKQYLRVIGTVALIIGEFLAWYVIFYFILHGTIV